ncbi:DUF4303 domain-containing protein [Acinetobacter variabilis]|uniref:DUF4303 domain-containing protein n=1 Tax=Acinetobacter variabilis TaxID=70346 RepID=N9NXE0_9GAMM|nr:DUF4303 domain-containing protein [Acinetobacter variabilis]ENX10241.1 hypothetical protein F897_01131 [Acinetobacter variabilis]UBI29274.1 DUF4303 domain-containing protein [Acinetobacter variabilis]
MLDYLEHLQQMLVKDFYQLYDRYQDDEIYACSLVFDKFLLLDDLAISTERSFFQDPEVPQQYLAEQDRWNLQKWRYKSHSSSQSKLVPFKTLLAEYFKTQHSFGHPVLAQQKQIPATHLDLLLETFKQAKRKLSEAYGLDLDSIIFFLSVPAQPECECQSALELNSDSRLLQDFLASRQTLSQSTVNKRLKLSQSDKDILIDLEQMLTIEPYDYLQVAQDTYLLTLESYFIDSNIYIQKLIQHIAAMAAEPDGSCGLSREEIMQRLQQFSANSPLSPDLSSIHR